MSESAAAIELQQRRAEYQALQFGLSNWIQTNQPVDAPANDPFGWNFAVRRQMADRILRAWRQETRLAYDQATGLFDTHQLLLRLDGNSLPDPDFILSARGFEHIEYLRIDGEAFPANGNAFLGKFTGLTHLKLDCMLTELPDNLTGMTQLQHLDLKDNLLVLTAESRDRLAGMTRLEELHLDGNPLGLTPDVSRMTRLRVLSLRQTNIEHWPIGAESRSGLRTLLLQENRLRTVPEAVFSDVRMGPTNRNTILHDNPLSDETLGRIRDYRTRTGIVIGGALPGILHRQAIAATHAATMPEELTPWLSSVPQAEHSTRLTLWTQLNTHSGDARPDDTFRALRDLRDSSAFRNTRPGLTQRVWKVLEAMGDSTELRDRIFLNTYQDGTCGDGAILTFVNMEIELKIHQARSQPSSAEADRDLLALAKGLFYLRQVDQLADAHIQRLYAQGFRPDEVEVKLAFRLNLRDAFELPIEPDVMRYGTGDMVIDSDIAQARVALEALGQTQAAQNELLMEEFWIDYLARSYPEPFSTVRGVIQYQINELNQAITDRRSDVYLERRQSLVELEIAERNRLVRQLTEAAQLAQQAN